MKKASPIVVKLESDEDIDVFLSYGEGLSHYILFGSDVPAKKALRYAD